MTLLQDGTLREITASEFAGFQQLIGDASGITLGVAKRQLLMGRIARTVRERALASYGTYLEVIRADRTGEELIHLLDLVSTNETRFFREAPHYRYLTEVLCPLWKQEAELGSRSRRVRVWSAACSTGQEPYSVAMTLLDHLPNAEGWTIEIVASDISTRALGVAAAGEYDLHRSSEIPTTYLRRFMLRGVGERSGSMRVSEALHAVTQFLRINLHEPNYALSGTFDLIFCSNALIYFSQAGRAAVVERLAQKLTAHGRLFVGHAESLHEHRSLLRAVATTAYARSDSTHS